jgi:hypothetical protein
MKTSATNKRVRELVIGIKNGTLVPNPSFQRRLVWANKHKIAFLQTVLEELPFPEIYIAAGELNPDTGEAKTMLVDGQQRVTTLLEYFNASKDLKLPKDMVPYADLSMEQKKNFLEYEVVVRDLGEKSIEEIRRIFKKINSTNYALNSMEIHNSSFDGPFIKAGEDIAKASFFEAHRVFNVTDIRRFQDLRFVLTVMITIMSTYFEADRELISYLERYNDEFEMEGQVRRELEGVFRFIDSCNLGERSRAWQKADLLTLLVELHRLLFREQAELDPILVGERLENFYKLVAGVPTSGENNVSVAEYYAAVIQGSNKRTLRISRGKIVRKVILGESLDADVIEGF